MSTKIIIKPKIEIESSLLEEIKNMTQEMGQVVIHFIYFTPGNVDDSRIRIWPTSYLYDHDSPHKSELVHAENISYYPEWHSCPPGSTSFFTLIFAGLPKACRIFDFIEHCDSQWGAFVVKNIPRNPSDVYYVKIY